MENRHVSNRKSPPSHDKYVRAYIALNPSSTDPNDGYDISAVTTKSGVPGYALLPQEINRSRNKESFHRGVDFISSEKLRKSMKK